VVFWLVFSGIITVIEGINVFLNVASGRKCIKVFEFIVYLGARAYLVVLFGHLYIYNLLLLEGPSCLIATAFYKVSVGFPFRLSRNLREE